MVDETVDPATDTPVDMGGRICKCLASISIGKQIPTKILMRRAGISDTDNRAFRMFRKVSEALHKADIVDRQGTRKFYWSLNDGWTITPPNQTTLESVLKKIRVGTAGGRSAGPDPDTQAKLNILQASVDALQNIVERIQSVRPPEPRTVEIKRAGKPTVRIEDAIVPTVFERVVALASQRRNVLLVGPSGCGKSFLAELVARALGLQFRKVGGSGGLSETDLLGRFTPNLTGGPSRFETTPFLESYETGGLMLVDELDGADSNVLLALNPALDRTGRLPVPKRTDNPAAVRHKDFVCVATANTTGRGATRQYAGRNALDESTLDRFRIGIVEMDYDPTVEAAVCPDPSLRKRLQDIRKQATDLGLRRIVSTRFLEDAFIMVSQAGWTIPDVVRTLTEGWTNDEKEKMGLS